MMNEIRLLTFYKVAVRRSFSRAAEELNLTQPAISKQIKVLEEELNVKLIDRTQNGVELTPQGKLVFQHAEIILKNFQNLRNELSLLTEKHPGELHLGASTTAAQYILPPLLAKYKQVNANMSISLLNENSTRIEQLLLEGKINLGIIEGLPDNHELEYTPFLNDELVAITH
ncbi:MAG: LysR family transcriptional regulator, partial [Bacteroidota bacterium]|nr:LysR family transcriptional regulator [Bacteroidota bacterium]